MSGVPMTTTETTIGINGMAHVILTVRQFATARDFYGRLLPALGMTPVCDTDKLFYCVGARTAIGIQPAGPAHNGDRFLQSRVGLHHLCLRARSREDVDRLRVPAATSPASHLLTSPSSENGLRCSRRSLPACGGWRSCSIRKPHPITKSICANWQRPSRHLPPRFRPHPCATKPRLRQPSPRLHGSRVAA